MLEIHGWSGPDSTPNHKQSNNHKDHLRLLAFFTPHTIRQHVTTLLDYIEIEVSLASMQVFYRHLPSLTPLTRISILTICDNNDKNRLTAHQSGYSCFYEHATPIPTSS